MKFNVNNIINAARELSSSGRDQIRVCEQISLGSVQDIGEETFNRVVNIATIAYDEDGHMVMYVGDNK